MRGDPMPCVELGVPEGADAPPILDCCGALLRELLDIPPGLGPPGALVTSSRPLGPPCLSLEELGPPSGGGPFSLMADWTAGLTMKLAPVYVTGVVSWSPAT